MNQSSLEFYAASVDFMTEEEVRKALADAPATEMTEADIERLHAEEMEEELVF